MTHSQIYGLFYFLLGCYDELIGEIPSNSLDHMTDIFFIRKTEMLLNDFQPNDLEIILNDERIIRKIRERKLKKDKLYDHPIVFLVYYLLKKHHNSFEKYFPYPPNDLEPFYVDLGISQRD